MSENNLKLKKADFQVMLRYAALVHTSEPKLSLKCGSSEVKTRVIPPSGNDGKSGKKIYSHQNTCIAEMHSRNVLQNTKKILA